METKKVKIYINDNDVEITIRLIRFPKKSLINGIKRYNDFLIRNTSSNFIKKNTDSIEKYNGIKLANYKSMWWIYYGEDRMTGRFDSKEKAIEWFEHAGR